MFKVLHWVFFIVFLLVLGTAIMNTTFFSKEAIMETFNFSFPMRDIYNIGYADQLFIARIERRAGWVFHFWAGVILFTIAVLRFIFILKTKKSFFQYFIYSTITIMFLSGLPLYVRAFIEIPQQYQDFARTIHYYSAWLFGLGVLLHIIKVIYKESTCKTSKISEMFHFKSTLLLMIIFSLISTSSYIYSKEIIKKSHYEIGMAYYKGTIGGKKIKIIMPNCPYEHCKKAKEMQKKMNVKNENGRKTIIIKKRDLKLALFYFEKSVFEDKNILAAEKVLNILLGEMNYKDKKLDISLLKRLSYELELNETKYKEKVKKILSFFENSNSCYGLFKYGEFIQNGYLNLFKNDNIKLEKVFKETIKNCPDNRMEKIITKSKLKKLKDI